jgi:hypothetical protein
LRKTGIRLLAARSGRDYERSHRDHRTIDTAKREIGDGVHLIRAAISPAQHAAAA